MQPCALRENGRSTANLAAALRCLIQSASDQFVMCAVLTACWNIESSAELMSAGVFAV
jgi:hypothetical protein